MIVQIPAPRRGKAFVASDRHAVDGARRELIRWLTEQGCAGNSQNRVFAIFDQGRVVREWAVVERTHSVQ
jgi:hypothetical protein